MNVESPDQADVLTLIAELDAYQHSLYPAESVYSLDLTAVSALQLICIVARDLDQRAVACGALVLAPEYGEIKRMYVHPTQRGQGLAKRLLHSLEAAAYKAGCRQVMLETGPRHTEALRLYAQAGFVVCGRFGNYRDDPLSVFMCKDLVA
ncbi:GNAT family N-acetyltransferase [Undibacterium sp. RTI2.1]|uniref:GNAT family N-acetyltransferase n=1 Tax=unclassified Undibacterium TaxID=2630295 RepID=UPI002AB58F1C|nr:MULTISPECIES: GNAT family N-acetyltransferase [unclassified Undibacterium]MDY7536959.1 GNAT family N-acetyltransferase [Undibacterium sp. 5I1]MEB0032638.1 GNAT family N-acetyltransferase [Undibacterium sp. RTI2.1]MEB0117992.1 GNAT family N-acetyltransferase [Undibacterium sp. RTI2.2]MEB0229509.1 GNAT family N-acetyltransferase [Undibacterium sp. 10I3]MEB0258862.1 GNAT family N-acetyltransferase [Undibacterium sp. 5I1]